MTPKQKKPLEFDYHPTRSKQPRFHFRDTNRTGCIIEEGGSFTKLLYLGITGHKMRLTQKQVQQLIPYLEHFAKTGELPREVIKPS